MLSRKFLICLSLVLIPILILVTIWILRPTNIILNEKDYEGIVFVPSNAADVLRFTLLQENIDEAHWLPSQADISRIETQLRKYVREGIPSLEGQILNYKRITLVFTARKAAGIDHRILWTNAKGLASRVNINIRCIARMLF